MKITDSSHKKFNQSVSMVSWAYNEEESILDFLNQATQLLDDSVEDYEIVIVDDASTDKTNSMILEFQKKNPRVKLLTNPTNVNVGISSARAIGAAKNKYLFWQTVDWAYDISALKDYLWLMESHDVVAGVRRSPVKSPNFAIRPLQLVMKLFSIKHVTRRSDTVGKAFVSLINYLLIRTLFRLPLSDYQNVVFYQTEFVQKTPKESRSSFCNPELLLKAHWSGKDIIEVPINFIPRSQGEAKGTRIGAIYSSVKDVFKFWFLWIVMGKMDRKNPGNISRLQNS